MGLFFTLFYVLAAFVGPQTIFGAIAEYHIQIVIAIITLICSVPGLRGSALGRLPQTYAIIGMSAAVFLSLAFNGWISGGPIALMDFVPNATVFFFVLLNCRKKLHLQMLVVVLFAAASYTTLQAVLALRAGNISSPYLLSMASDEAGDQIIRIRGLSFISDPNDLAQFFVGLIPCLFLFWRKGSRFTNLLLVYLPIISLIYGMFLTHSRGGMVALLAVVIVAGRRKIGVIPAIVLGAVLFLGLSASGWSGGRDVSASSGQDRMDAWGVGLGLIRTHPIFGVGFGRFADFNQITAHNTVVVCAAELGLSGFFFWMLFILPTLRDLVGGSAPSEGEKQSDEDSSIPGRYPPRVAIRTATPGFQSNPFLQRELAAATGQTLSMGHNQLRVAAPGGLTESPAELRKTPRPASAPLGMEEPTDDFGNITDDEIRRLSSLMVVSFAGFLAAGWFLSRAFVMTLYVNAGIAEAVYRMARHRGIAPPILGMLRASKLSCIACTGFLLLVYLILRMDHFMPH